MKTNAHFLFYATSLIFLLASCQSVNKAELLQGTPTQRASQFVEKGWAFPLGNSIAEIKTNLGKPESEDVEKAKLSSESASAYAALGVPTAEIHHLRYKGLIVDVYQQPSEKTEFVSKVLILDSKYPMRWGLHVDVSTDEVIRVLGKPASQTDEKLEYESENSTASFTVNHGRITQVEWLPSAD